AGCCTICRFPPITTTRRNRRRHASQPSRRPAKPNFNHQGGCMSFLRRGPRVRRALLLGFALLMALAAAPGASAHERRAVGDYEIVIGFLNEPAIVEEPNGLDLRVSRGG